MKSVVEENIDGLSRAILSEARAESEHLLAEAREKAEMIRRQAQEQSETERQSILARAKEESERLRGQTVATTQLKARTMQLEHREKLLDQVLKKAYQDLPGIQQWTEYPQIAQDLLREALQQLQASQVVLRADAKTLSILNQRAVLQQIGQEYNTEIQVGQPLEKGIGILVEAANGRLQFDNTFETRLGRMRNDLRTAIYQRLMGEAV